MTMTTAQCHVYDAVIAGAGPAGCVAALQLARAGIDVLVLEPRTRYERRLGETLPPAATHIMHELAVWDEFMATDPVPAWLNATAWGAPELRFDDFMFSSTGPGWHVDRGRFEALLSAAAGRAGATIRLGCSIATVHSDDDTHRVQFTHEGMLLTVRAHFFVDASGRGRHAWQQQTGRRQIDRLIGIGMAVRVPPAHDAASYTMIESINDGWFYSAQVNPTEIVACYMTDADIYARAQGRKYNEFLTRLAEAPHTRSRLATASKVCGSWCAAAGSSLRTMAAGQNWMAIGDAAMSCDPLSASGLISALMSGIHAGRVLTEAGVASRERDLQEWSAYLTSTFSSYLAMRRHYYGLEPRFAGSLFWKRRQESGVETSSFGVPAGPNQPSTQQGSLLPN